MAASRLVVALASLAAPHAPGLAVEGPGEARPLVVGWQLLALNSPGDAG